jgi:predicted MFS family arabinose efflux permease
MTARVRGTQILVVLAVINLVSYAARNALFAVYPDLTARYGIDDAEIGLLGTVFMLPHAAATLGFGWAGDRFDRRRVIAVGMVIASIAGAIGAIGASYLGLAISRAAVGFGTAAVVPVANSILGQIFDGPHKASRLAVFNLGLFVGGVVGFGVGTALGFPLVVIALALPGVVLAAVVMTLTVPAHPAPSGESPQARAPGPMQLGMAVRLFVSDVGELLRIRTLRWVIVSTSVMAFAAGGFGSWLQEFLVREKGMSKESATSLLVLALVGGLSGILAGARISDRLSTRVASGRMWTIVIGMVLTAPCAAAAILLPAGPVLYVIGVATLFFISWYHAPMAATVDDLAPPRLAVSAQALVIFTMHMVGTAPSSWVVGLISREWSIESALWTPAVALLVAAAAMAVATSSYATDRAKARSSDGMPPQASL